jgi:uncharacterized alkaline shock family protein YloU
MTDTEPKATSERRGQSGTDSGAQSEVRGQTAAQRRSSAVSARPSPGSRLQTERGTTTIADAVVAKIATLAAQEVYGVSRLGGAMSGAIGSVVGRFRGSEHDTSGVSVEVGEREAAIDIIMTVEYPASLHEVADAVRERVIERVESMTSLRVVEVNIQVTDLSFPGQEQDQSQEPPRVQ